MTFKSGAIKSIAVVRHPNFCFSYWLLCLDGRAFVSVFWRLLAWPLVKWSPRVEKLLLVSPDTPYERC